MTAGVDEVRAAVTAARARGERIALVPTSGALHAGHLALVARAREVARLVVLAVPAGAPEHPSTGADLVVALPAPAGDERSRVRLLAGSIGAVLEGRARPGHFDGLLTSLLRLLHVVGPDVLVLGRKHAQEVFLVQRMLLDLDLPVSVEVVETVREPDGLAVGSGTASLAPGERRPALAVTSALEAAESFADRDVDSMLAAAQGALAGEDGADLGYLSIVDPATFRPVDDGYRGRALVLVAARVGGTRLIDNRFVHLG